LELALLKANQNEKGVIAITKNLICIFSSSSYP